MIHRLLAILLVVVALLPLRAEAGGYTLPVHGVRPLSLGGASVASAEGADAIWYNPANLGATALSLEASVISLDATFQSANGGPAVESTAPLLPNPQLGLVWKAHERLSIALGAYAPYAGQLRFAEDGPQRYALVENHNSTVLFLHLAAGIRLGNFRLGGGIQNVMAHVRQRIVLSGYTGLFGYASDPELDVLAELDLNDPVNITANFGASWDLGPVTLALAAQLPFTVAGEATFRERLPSSVFFDNAAVEGDRAHLEIPFPFQLRAGVALHATEWLRIEAAGSFEDWSVQQRLVIEPIDMRLTGIPAIGDYRLPPVVLERRMRDTFSVHLGGEADLGKGFRVRSGFFYEPSAFDDATFSMALPDDDKIGIALGGGFSFAQFRVDASLARVIQGSREVRSSELRQVNPTNPGQAEVIANGTYDTGYWMGGLSFAWIPGVGEHDAAPDLGRPSDTLDISLDK
ncbi:MAG: outer membrane protein transport protein [Deltaproteobacteria bacterium]|nr:outer membrane protein transport protein [Deltaproteobacteria bacterium]